VIRLKKNGYRWELAEELPLDALLVDPGRRVKESRVKLVTVHDIAGKTYYVKRYRHAAVPLRPLKFFFKPSQARQEWTIAQNINAPIVRHLALGERWTPTGLQESILITEGFAGHEPTDADAPRVLAFVRQLHAAGVLQRDLHPGNILVNGDELRLVDLHGTELRAPTAAETAENLARLRMFLPIDVPPNKELERRFLAHRARRCLKRNRDFDRQDGWYYRKAFWKPAWRDTEAFFARARILKRGRTSLVGAADGVVIKQYNLRRPSRLLKDLFRRSRAVRAYQKAYHLELAGIATARPLAAGRRGFTSWLVMEEIPNARPASVEAARKLIERLHEAGFSHRDLKPSNIVMNDKGEAVLIDLEGLRFVGEVSPQQRAKDWARFERG
jgi:tRNA A-37 threonylcarbamoyl transferase component Bud32